MDEYKKLLTQVKEYLNQEQSISENEISLFDLCQIVEEFLLPLKQVLYENELANEINNSIKKERLINESVNSFSGLYDILAGTSGNISKLVFFKI